MLAEVVLFSTLVLQAGSGPPAPRPALQFRVIVHSTNPVDSISRQQLSAIYMKKVRQWPNRTEIAPVDQSPTSRVRERFSDSVHGKSVAYVTRYWHRVIFSGRGLPPFELSSSAAVAEFVSENRGAIGYVSPDLVLGDGVKVITVTP
jgi:ABC-type phosphate transport system substrate-binding protein